MRSRRGRYQLVACLFLAAGLALLAAGASQVAIDVQLVIAIAYATLSLRVRDYP